MGFMSTKEIIVSIFVIMPIVTLIHEIGHACIAKLSGCRLKRIVIGNGKNFLRLGFLEIKRMYFFWGWYETYDLAQTKTGRVMVHLGGVLFNLISILIAVLLVNAKIIELQWIMRLFIVISIYTIILSLLPLTYSGSNSDGKQIYQTIKYRKSVCRKTEEKSQ